MPIEESDTDISAYGSLGNTIVETESSTELVKSLEVDDLIFLSVPTARTLNSHVHEECIRPNTLVVSLAYLLLKYREII